MFWQGSDRPCGRANYWRKSDNDAPHGLELQFRAWHFRYSRPENALGRSGALDRVRRSPEHSTCLLSPALAKGIKVGEEDARADQQ
jgi:hypothetical protein